MAQNRILRALSAAALLAAANLFYVFVYTIWLKRRTPQNIVIGGAAGAFPPLIGWAAVTGHVALYPVILFLIIFLWTPPHFWALSLFASEDYKRARIPMLQVVTIIITLTVLAALTLFLKRTRYGLEMRAAAENFTMARMLGVRANDVTFANVPGGRAPARNNGRQFVLHLQPRQRELRHLDRGPFDSALDEIHSHDARGFRRPVF